MPNFDFIRQKTSGHSMRGFRKSNFANLFCRFVMLIMAIVVIGYYASDIRAARKVHKYADSKWVFALVVGCLAAFTCLIYMIIGAVSQIRTVAIFFAWDWILVILWAAVSGLFGNMYLNEKVEMDKGVAAMKTAVGFDITNLVFWFISAVVSTYIWMREGRRTLHTGRARA